MSARTKVHIADDHTLMAEGLRSSLAGVFEVTGISTSAAAVRRDLAEALPDLLLLDVSLGKTNGLKLVRPLLDQYPAPRIVIVTMHSDALLADTAFRAGAHGFVPKDSGTADLITAIRTVMAGTPYLSPAVPARDEPGGPRRPSVSTGLSHRQLDVLAMIGDGKSSEAIAEALGVTVATVTYHRQRIRLALGLDTEWDLLRYAILAKGRL